MIVITFIHDFKRITKVLKNSIEDLSFDKEKNIQRLIFEFAQQYPDCQLVWVYESLFSLIDYNWIVNNVESQIFQFYNPSKIEFLTNKVGYIEPSPFVKINKNVSFASWQASAFVGFISSQDYINFGKKFITSNFSFGYFLTIMSKIGNRNGLRTYSNPNLLLEKEVVKPQVGSTKELFYFTAQYYGFAKCFQLFLLFILHENKIPILLLLNIISVKRIIFDLNTKVSNQEGYNVASREVTLDVLIPTIGRRKYLQDVLCDLKSQTIIPNRIIIVEQNPSQESKSELDYLKNEIWPFEIVHHFIHQTGACNARNIALKDLKNDWVFFADDDIRLSSNFIENCLKTILNNSGKAFTLACFRYNEKPVFQNVMHWDTFGSGCSIVKREALKDLSFDLRFENGFGEDADFGMQLRNKGYDILYLPQPQILHLKAPVGGFRVKPILPWQEEIIKPKPSPTIMLFKLIYHTKEQIAGYKLNLFLKYYKQQSIRNPFKYFKLMQKQWVVSEEWAKKLKSQSK